MGIYFCNLLPEKQCRCRNLYPVFSSSWVTFCKHLFWKISFAKQNASYHEALAGGRDTEEWRSSKTSTVHKSNLVRSVGFQISPEITQRLCSYLRAGGGDRYMVVRCFSSSWEMKMGRTETAWGSDLTFPLLLSHVNWIREFTWGMCDLSCRAASPRFP